ncbi:transglutaminase-like cysteine peptidase [Rhodosalinus sp. FB01]|uniref:transglutaminase-like cysteine peptidase n=1 Tax=Rhodosalinus sp. FB01 TaxID=3239194 RepID=UPI00352367CF
MILWRAAATAALLAACSAAAGSDARGCPPLALAVARTEPPPSQYAAFCGHHPDACRLGGAARLEWTPETRAALARVNREVNAQVRLLADQECLGLEDLWDFPREGVGDCEDFALEKRRRLVALGLPGASLTMAIVHHRERFFAHAVLLAETTHGTWVLDNLAPQLTCWNASPYRYERRERPDGLWDRFTRHQTAVR